ncbi:radical SAM protein [Candidatus Microgenomates bacterium]|nr:radical SAM protein [Candidatus Microgenomates bacterium]
MKELAGQHIETEIKTWFPQAIDINPTARCNLDCSFCWGPDHNIPDGLDTEDWKRTIDFFGDHGTKAIVFTGGEPLLRHDIGELMQHSKDKNMRVTLSTNTLLLARRANAVLPYTDEIGIPMDGSTVENNIRMRLGTRKHFQTVLSSLDLLKDFNPDIEVTIRTVVSAVNEDDIEQIGEVLAEHKDAFNRWKLYQFSPVSIGAEHKDEHEISSERFGAITSAVVSKFDSLNVQIYPSEQRVGRYVFIGPEGNIFGVGDDGDYKIVGNFLSMNEEEIYDGIKGLVSPQRNIFHGH